MVGFQDFIRPRFEYRTVYVKALGVYQTEHGSWRPLDELGEQGWEMISVVNDGGDLVAFLKRVVENPN
ncbi:MAG: hypothetical protein ACFE0I_06990 [Elainellaceae cyanobacterium]